MILKNFPLNNARPKNITEAQHYVDALALKRQADELAEGITELNQNDYVDLDGSESGVALNSSNVHTNTLSTTSVKGTLSLSRDDKGELQADSMNIRVSPKYESNSDFSFRREDNRLHYTRRYHSQENVTHLVHDLSTDRISMFIRDQQGRFVEEK